MLLAGCLETSSWLGMADLSASALYLAGEKEIQGYENFFEVFRPARIPAHIQSLVPEQGRQSSLRQGLRKKRLAPLGPSEVAQA